MLCMCDQAVLDINKLFGTIVGSTLQIMHIGKQQRTWDPMNFSNTATNVYTNMDVLINESSMYSIKKYEIELELNELRHLFVCLFDGKTFRLTRKQISFCLIFRKVSMHLKSRGISETNITRLIIVLYGILILGNQYSVKL